MQALNSDTKDLKEVVHTVSYDQSYAEEGLEGRGVRTCLMTHDYQYFSKKCNKQEQKEECDETL
jgi:hypothetical protein